MNRLGQEEVILALALQVTLGTLGTFFILQPSPPSVIINVNLIRVLLWYARFVVI
jgi:hypothetical protein